jgi:hypothetical protein
MELLDLLKSLLEAFNGLNKSILFLVELRHEDDFFVLYHEASISELSTDFEWPLLLPPEGLNISIVTFERKVIKHAVVLVDIIELLRQVLNFVRCILDEVASFDKLALISWLFHDGFVHVFIGLVDSLDRALAPLIDLLLELILNLEGLVAETFFHPSGYNTE